MKKLIIFTILLALVGYNTTCHKVEEVFVDSELKPMKGLEEADINSVAVVNFDASAVKEKGVDKIALRDMVTYDIIREMYQLGKIRVIQGTAVQGVQEAEKIEVTKGDYETAKSIIERTVTYKYNPYQKVDAVLSGRITDYVIIDEDDPSYNYIEIQLQLVDSVDGTIYWITRIRGNYKDVIYTIAHTISNKTYTEPPLPVKAPTIVREEDNE